MRTSFKTDDSFVFLEGAAGLEVVVAATTTDASVPHASNTADDTVFSYPQADHDASGLPKLTSATSDDATKGDIEPVVDAAGNFLLCRESTGECIEWPSG